MIPITKSFLPPITEYMAQLERAYTNEWLTNRGELVLELEAKLRNYLALEASNLLITNNGTIPLQIALKLLGQSGEVITTPFSYVATTAAIAWENCTPVFVDIHPEYLTIDETKIEAAITNKTTCILATHVFGNPCNVEVIETIAKKHHLKVIYDAAHCFGVQYKGKSIFEYGDVSTCSFHATKLFHTGEGGAIFSKDKELFDKIFYSHNFGHDGPLAFHGLGINGKISELQAAMGLAVLPYMKTIIKARREIVSFYNKHLDFAQIQKIKIREGTLWNNSYYPILFKHEEALLAAQQRLNDRNIFPRRYFYPSLNKLPYVAPTSCPISEDIAARVFCLPLYVGLQEKRSKKHNKRNSLMKKNAVVFCAGPHARVILDLLSDLDEMHVVGIIDAVQEIGSSFYGYPVIGRQHELNKLSEIYNFHAGIVALGDNYLREKVVLEIEEQIEDFEFINVIARNTSFSKTTQIGVGNVFMPGVIINSEARIGNHCIINTNSSLEHNSVMEDYSSLSAGVTSGGYFSLGRYSAIALGVTVLDRTSIGENVVVGSGSLVTKDLKSHGLYYGVPAKKIRDRKPFERFLK